MQIEDSIVVAAPLNEVFAYASDWQHWAEWFKGVSDFRPTTAIERGNGARYAYRASLMGIPASVETEIADFAENGGWTGVSVRGMAHRTSWRFEPHGEGTRFSYRMEYQLPLPLLGPALDALLLRRHWRRTIKQSLSNLQAHFAGTGGEPGGQSAGTSHPAG